MDVSGRYSRDIDTLTISNTITRSPGGGNTCLLVHSHDVTLTMMLFSDEESTCDRLHIEV